MKSLKKASVALIAFAWMLPAVQAADVNAGHAMPMSSGSIENAALSDGEIRKVDKSAGKVTIKHGPLANLEMMPMTMVFRVKDAEWLNQMKAGDKIRFRAESINGALTVVKYESVK